MREVLSEPEHKLSNCLFIILNVLAILTVLGGLADAIYYLAVPPSLFMPHGFQLWVAFLTLCGSTLAACFLVGFGQILRYVATIAHHAG